MNSSLLAFKQFFAILWDFLFTCKVPLINIPLVALLVGPLALTILLGSLDKILGFGMPGVISTVRSVRSGAMRDDIHQERKATYASARAANNAKASSYKASENYFKNKK